MKSTHIPHSVALTNAKRVTKININSIALSLNISTDLARAIYNGTTARPKDVPYNVVTVFDTACLEVPTLTGELLHIPIMKLPYERGWISYCTFEQIILFYQACTTLSRLPRPTT